MLGIESSCDDTAAAVVRGDGTIVSEAIASQAGVHEEWGGVVPKLAQAAHRKAIDATVDDFNFDARLLADIDDGLNISRMCSRGAACLNRELFVTDHFAECTYVTVSALTGTG